MLKDRQRSTGIIKQSAVPREFLANLRFLADGRIEQSRTVALKDFLQKASPSEIRAAIDKLLDLIPTLWNYRIHEHTFKLASNYGLLNNSVVLIDPFELTQDEDLIICQLNKRPWEKPSNFAKYTTEEVASYLDSQALKKLTKELFISSWDNR